MLPAHSRYVIVGAGIHGLSTAWHLARELRAPRPRRRRRHPRPRQDRRRRRRVRDRVRRHPQQLLPAGDARADGALGSGLGVGPRGVRLPPRRVTCRSRRRRCTRTSRRSSPSSRRSATRRCSSRASATAAPTCWTCSTTGRRRGITAILHEKKGGYANNVRSLRGLAAKAEVRGRPDRAGGPRHRRAHRRRRGHRGRDRPGRGAAAISSSSRPARGSATCGRCWTCPARSRSRGRDGTVHEAGRCGPTGPCRRGRWRWTRRSSPTTGARFPPVLHVDSSAPLYDDTTGDLITDRMWGIYYKPDFYFGGVQGGTSPYVVDRPRR